MTAADLATLVARLRRASCGLARFATLPAAELSLRFGLSPEDAEALLRAVQEELR